MKKFIITIILIVLVGFSCISKNTNLNVNGFSFANPRHIIDIAESYIASGNVKLTDNDFYSNDKLVKRNIPKVLTHSHLIFYSLEYHLSGKYAEIEYLIIGTQNQNNEKYYDIHASEYCFITLRIDNSGKCDRNGPVVNFIEDYIEE
jgi:hypothetical protein